MVLLGRDSERLWERGKERLRVMVRVRIGVRVRVRVRGWVRVTSSFAIRIAKEDLCLSTFFSASTTSLSA